MFSICESKHLNYLNYLVNKSMAYLRLISKTFILFFNMPTLLSFIYILINNKSGPKLGPWSTLQITLFCSDYLTFKQLPASYLSHSVRIPKLILNSVISIYELIFFYRRFYQKVYQSQY